MNCSTWNRIILFFASIVPRGTIPNYSGYTLMIAGCARHNSNEFDSALTCTAIPNS